MHNSSRTAREMHDEGARDHFQSCAHYVIQSFVTGWSDENTKLCNEVCESLIFSPIVRVESENVTSEMFFH